MEGTSITNATPNESSPTESLPVENPLRTGASISVPSWRMLPASATTVISAPDLIEETTAENSSATPVDPIPDTRLYVPDHEDWDVHIKRDSERYFCYSKHPGEDWFHLILNGEIYVSHQHEKYCLRCALRMGSLTEDRLFWQHRVPKKRPLVV